MLHPSACSRYMAMILSRESKFTPFITNNERIFPSGKFPNRNNLLASGIKGQSVFFPCSFSETEGTCKELETKRVRCLLGLPPGLIQEHTKDKLCRYFSLDKKKTSFFFLLTHLNICLKQHRKSYFKTSYVLAAWALSWKWQWKFNQSEKPESRSPANKMISCEGMSALTRL